MGEMADMHADAWDFDDWDPYYDIELGYRTNHKTCRRCGAGQLHWVNIGTYQWPTWRLFEPNNTQHQCVRRINVPNFHAQWAAEVPYLRWARGFKYNLHKYKCSTSH